MKALNQNCCLFYLTVQMNTYWQHSKVFTTASDQVGAVLFDSRNVYPVVTKGVVNQKGRGLRMKASFGWPILFVSKYIFA